MKTNNSGFSFNYLNDIYFLHFFSPHYFPYPLRKNKNMTADWVLGKKKKEDRLLIRIYAPTVFKRDLAIIKVGKKMIRHFLR